MCRRGSRFIIDAHDLVLKLAKPLQVVATAIIMALLLVEMTINSEREVLNSVAKYVTFRTPELTLDLLLAFELLELLL